MAEAHIPHSPTAGATPDMAREARARAWDFVMDSYANKNAAGADSTNGDDVKESENESRRKAIIPNRQ